MYLVWGHIFRIGNVFELEVSRRRRRYVSLYFPETDLLLRQLFFDNISLNSSTNRLLSPPYICWYS